MESSPSLGNWEIREGENIAFCRKSSICIFPTGAFKERRPLVIIINNN